MAIKTEFHPWCNAIQAPPPTDRAALASPQGLMTALHALGSLIGLRPPTAMPWATFMRRRSAVALGVCSRRDTRPPSTVSGRCGGISRGTFTLLGPLAKQHRPEPLQAEPRLLYGEQQPKVPREHVPQHTPIVGGQGIAV